MYIAVTYTIGQLTLAGVALIAAAYLNLRSRFQTLSTKSVSLREIGSCACIHADPAALNLSSVNSGISTPNK